MCETCGCGEHLHEERTVTFKQDILLEYNQQAEQFRAYLRSKRIYCLNLMSSPGSGKTTLLEETIRRLTVGTIREQSQLPIYVIEGDQHTDNDTHRIAALHVPVLQINTGTGCHLEAKHTMQAIKQLNPEEDAILFIENVGNLVCPSIFDLGETRKVLIVSTTEGEDKPLKYPYIFQEADVCIINKIDLLPYLQIDMQALRSNALKVNPHLRLFEVSALKGTGMDIWCSWLIEELAKCK